MDPYFTCSGHVLFSWRTGVCELSISASIWKTFSARAGQSSFIATWSLGVSPVSDAHVVFSGRLRGLWKVFACLFVCLFVCLVLCLFVCLFFYLLVRCFHCLQLHRLASISIEIDVAQITTCQFSKPRPRQEGGSPRQVELRSIGTFFGFHHQLPWGHVPPPPCCSR